MFKSKVNKINTILSKSLSNSVSPKRTSKFETVFSFPFVKYVGVLNRLKVYQMIGSSVAIPSCGILEMLSVVPDYTFLMTSYIGLSGTAVLTLASLPFKNIIGYLYISEDNQSVKISSVDFWGKRKDKIVPVQEWVPLLDMSPKFTDAIYLTPQLSDGTKYKLFVKFGNVLNASKIGKVLE